MKLYLSLIAFFLITAYGFSQGVHKFVKLSEEKKGKRLVLFANNTDTIPYNIFLKVDTKDFRRSSNRPIIKNIPANSKTKLITLIQLNGTEGKYNSIFVVNEVTYTIEIEKSHEAIDFKLDREIKDQKVVLYTKTNCFICPKTKQVLEKNKIPYTEFNIDKDSTNYLMAIKEFQKNKKTVFRNDIPLLKIDDKLYNNIKTVNDFTTALNKGLNK